MRVAKNATIVVLAALVLWFGISLARVENERYALELGMCGEFKPEEPKSLTERRRCLDQVQTRTNALYNLAYALGM
jgi:hypothetical protein